MQPFCSVKWLGWLCSANVLVFQNINDFLFLDSISSVALHVAWVLLVFEHCFISVPAVSGILYLWDPWMGVKEQQVRGICLIFVHVLMVHDMHSIDTMDPFYFFACSLGEFCISASIGRRWERNQATASKTRTVMLMSLLQVWWLLPVFLHVLSVSGAYLISIAWFQSLDRPSGFSVLSLSLLTGLVPISIGGSLHVPVPQIC
jgi:hypothetical protein